MMHFLPLFLALTCFVSFGWSIKRFFKAPEGMPSGMKTISIIGGVSMILHLISLLSFRPSHPLLPIVGIILYGASLTIFWWTIEVNRAKPLTLAYSSDCPDHLVEAGPYRWIRHPFYLSYTLAWLGGVAATGQAWLLVTVGVMFILYRRAALLEEKKFLESPLSESYAAYCRQTGRFLPSFWK